MHVVIHILDAWQYLTFEGQYLQVHLATNIFPEISMQCVKVLIKFVLYFDPVWWIIFNIHTFVSLLQNYVVFNTVTSLADLPVWYIGNTLREIWVRHKIGAIIGKFIFGLYNFHALGLADSAMDTVIPDHVPPISYWLCQNLFILYCFRLITIFILYFIVQHNC